MSTWLHPYAAGAAWFLHYSIIKCERRGGREDLGVDVAGVPAADQIPAEIGGRVDDQVAVVQLHHFRVVQTGGHGDGAEALFHVADDFGPYIGGRIHKFSGPFLLRDPGGKRPEKEGLSLFFAYFLRLNFIIISQKKQGYFGNIHLNKAIREK